ncbi:DUF6074 family protein [Sinorhizobium sp. RAC02]|uniref:DUF6074 family protein n=1 Tax=Sinorhizobium sp. RAC02 TaxID=1842534 RepID=UPI00083D85DD|nr:DUF6074 family protein [Sinorhizobium sp. RAC02]AOF89381.1 hypothetical protein BSY16_3987 [Sinorhizobium sp. RAC02]
MIDCQVIPFPLAARVGKIRRCAEVLQSSPNQPVRDAYWRKTVAHLREKLEALGLPDEAVRHEIRQFRSAVQQEYLRRDYIVYGAGNAPDGAA